jgi:hypothetical protein
MMNRPNKDEEENNKGKNGSFFQNFKTSANNCFNYILGRGNNNNNSVEEIRKKEISRTEKNVNLIEACKLRTWRVEEAEVNKNLESGRRGSPNFRKLDKPEISSKLQSTVRPDRDQSNNIGGANKIAENRLPIGPEIGQRFNQPHNNLKNIDSRNYNNNLNDKLKVAEVSRGIYHREMRLTWYIGIQNMKSN